MLENWFQNRFRPWIITPLVPTELGKDFVVTDSWIISPSRYWLPISFKITTIDLDSAPIMALLNPNRQSVPLWMAGIKYSTGYSLNGGHLTSAPSSSSPHPSLPPSCESYEWNTSSTVGLWSQHVTSGVIERILGQERVVTHCYTPDFAWCSLPESKTTPTNRQCQWKSKFSLFKAVCHMRQDSTPLYLAVK